MARLKLIKGRSWVLEPIGRAARIGFYIAKTKEVLLIDAGSREMVASVLRFAKTRALSIKTALLTHSHPDHMLGAQLLKVRTGCKLLASAATARELAKPSLRWRTLGMRSLRVDRIVRPGYFEFGKAKLRLISLPGHAPGMLGVRTPDDVLYSSDCLFSQDYLAKHRLIYHFDPAEQRATLKALAKTNYSYYLPSHGRIFKGIKTVIEANIKAIDDTARAIKRWRGMPSLAVAAMLLLKLGKRPTPKRLAHAVLVVRAYRKRLAR